MAQAKRVNQVQLALTQDEAETLHVILDYISGPPTGRRGHCDNIKRALNECSLRLTSDSDSPIGRLDLVSTDPQNIAFEETVTHEE